VITGLVVAGRVGAGIRSRARVDGKLPKQIDAMEASAVVPTSP